MTRGAADPVLAGHDPALLVDRHFERSAAAAGRFFDVHADLVSRTCLDLATRFERGGRLLVFGSGAEATDAQHVAVEFVHPVLVGKRALPALALPADVAGLTGVARDRGPTEVFAHAVRVLGRDTDSALAICRAAPDDAVRRGLDQARRAGLLTVALLGAEADDVADHTFVVDHTDPFVVQEVQETLYHIVWELVHVFLDRGSA